MPKTNTDLIEAKIRQSLLLSDQNKQQLILLLPSLSPGELREAETLLDSESGRKSNMIEQVIESAVLNKDTEALETLRTMVKSIPKTLRKTHERASDVEDDLRMHDIASYFEPDAS